MQISLTAEAYSNAGLTTGHKFIYNMLSAIHVIYNRGYAQHHEWLQIICLEIIRKKKNSLFQAL